MYSKHWHLYIYVKIIYIKISVNICDVFWNVHQKEKKKLSNVPRNYFQNYFKKQTEQNPKASFQIEQLFLSSICCPQQFISIHMLFGTIKSKSKYEKSYVISQHVSGSRFIIWWYFLYLKKQESVENLTALRFIISHTELNQSPLLQYKHKLLFFIHIAALLQTFYPLSLLAFLFISLVKWHSIAMAVKMWIFCFILDPYWMWNHSVQSCSLVPGLWQQHTVIRQHPWN